MEHIPPATLDFEADFVIVGAGSAGCVLANRLSANPAYSVILIEAGGADTHPFIHMPAGFVHLMNHPALNWLYASQPQAHLDGRVMAMPRGKVMGGTSSINGMLYVRGQSADYDGWAQQAIQAGLLKMFCLISKNLFMLKFRQHCLMLNCMDLTARCRLMHLLRAMRF